MSAVQSRGAILILDDDPNFRLLIRSLLEAKGYRVLEATSPGEATSKLEKNKIILAIVDYKLPETDGITWISKIRESGKNIPLIFCSALSCDSKNFTWLRNILHVALIVQKPIIPSTFLQQVDSLIPESERPSQEKHELVAYSNEDDFKHKLEERQRINDKKKFERTLKIERAITKARQEYSHQLETEWSKLTHLIGDRTDNINSIIEASHIAHQIKGTSGSLGFESISETAGKLEHYLSNIDIKDSTSNEVIWSEIMRSHALGELQIQDALREVRTEESLIDDTILVYTTDSVLIDNAHEHNCYPGPKSFEIEICQEFNAARETLKQSKVKGLLLDLRFEQEKASFLLTDTRAVRDLPGYESIPIGAIIESSNNPIVDTEISPLLLEDLGTLVYSGVSELCLWSEGSVLDLDNLGSLLITTPSLSKFRVMIVDDDDILCNFISRSLESDGIATSYCTSPLDALDFIESFKPDLIMLDVIMPGLTGYELARAIKQRENFKEIPIVFLTSKIDTESRYAAFEAGATDFLSKPILSSELRVRIQAHLSLIARQHPGKKLDIDTGLLTADALLPIGSSIISEFGARREFVSLALILLKDTEETTLRYGPEALKLVSQSLGRLILKRFRPSDLKVRWSDMLFAMVLPQCDHKTTQEALELLRTEFEQIRFNTELESFHSNFDFSIASLPSDGEDIQSLVKIAHEKIVKSLVAK